MLNNALPIDSSYKLLERTFRVLLRGIDRRMQKVLLNKAAVMEMSLSQVMESETAPCLRIARTTLPDNRLDFNQTFQQIRFGLDEFYRDRNPIFNNSPVLGVKQENPTAIYPEQGLLKASSRLNQISEIFHKEDEITDTDNTGIFPLWIAKTTLPNERLDFNKTFLHIRTEIDKFYKAQNPVFDNTIPPQFWPNQSLINEQQLNIYNNKSLIEQGIQSNVGEQKGNLPEPINTTITDVGIHNHEEDPGMEISFHYHCNKTESSNQEEQLINNENTVESGLNLFIATDQDYCRCTRQKTDRSSQVICHSFTDAFKKRKDYNHHLRRDRKKRRFQRPVRTAVPINLAHAHVIHNNGSF